MSEENQFDKQFDNDPERTLITLEQLSQTIEVMTSVVNRLRQHLSEQLKAQIETQHQEKLELEKAARPPPLALGFEGLSLSRAPL